MNLPNRLTLSRVALTPVFVALLLLNTNAARIAAACLFALLSATDFVDGYLARTRGQVTNFGKLMDPMADKLLVMTALVGLLALGRASPVAVMLILGREFVVSGVRMVALAKGLVIAADQFGKLKTVAQMVAILLLTLPAQAGPCMTVGTALLWVSVGLSLLSVTLYILRNREVLKE